MTSRSRAPGRGRHGDELGQWRRHPCERGRALVAAWHAGARSSAGSARRTRRCSCATARFRICGAGVSTSRATARPSGSGRMPRPISIWRCIRCARCRRSAPRPASRMTARRGACQDLPHARGARRRGAFDRLPGAARPRLSSASTPERCVDLEPALRDTRDTLAGGLYFERDEVGDCNKFTQGLASASAAAGVRFRFGETVHAIEAIGGRISAVVTDRDRIAADTSSSRWAASRLRFWRRSASACRSIRSRASRSPFRAARGTARRPCR